MQPKQDGSVQLTNSPPISFPVFLVWVKIAIDTVVCFEYGTVHKPTPLKGNLLNVLHIR